MCGASRPIRTRSSVSRLRRVTTPHPPATSGSSTGWERPHSQPTWAAPVARPLTLHARADAVRGTNRATGDPLPLLPPARVALGAELHRIAFGWADRTYAGAEVEVTTRQTRLNPLDIPTGGHTLLNLSAGIVRPLFGRVCHVDITVRNATNVSYRSFLSRYKEFALDPGRNVVLRISLGD